MYFIEKNKYGAWVIYGMYEDYYEPSEADEIFLEATNKLVGLIEERAKEEITNSLKAAKKKERQIVALQKVNSENYQQILSLKQEVNKLKEQLEEKHNEIPTFPFEIGQEVLVVVPSFYREKVTCQTCGGTGFIKGEITTETL